MARSSAEAEFRAVAQGICELLWLKLLLGELKIADIQPMKLYCDNKAAIDISHNPVHHDRTKHVEVDRHFIKEKIEEGVISMTYVPTSQQTTDLLTKGLVKPVFEKLVDKLGMFNVFLSSLRGSVAEFEKKNRVILIWWLFYMICSIYLFFVFIPRIKDFAKIRLLVYVSFKPIYNPVI